MKVQITYLGLLLTLTLLGCKKPIKEFEIISNGQKETLKIYADSTFSLNDYSGNWNGKLNEGDTISITSTINGYNIMTLTPSKSFHIINGKLNQIKKDRLQKGWKLSEFLDFSTLEKVKLRNVNGPHYLTEKQWDEIKSNIINSRSVGGLICKPKWLAFIFEFKNGKSIEGSICGNLINFEGDISGSFRIQQDINFHNY